MDASSPSRRRGLKFRLNPTKRDRRTVVSLAETWIEIVQKNDNNVFGESSPSRRRGLK